MIINKIINSNVIITGKPLTHAGIGIEVGTIGVVVDAIVKASRSRFSSLLMNETIHFDCLLGK